MSALGQKQTYAVQKVMSALHPIADMCGATSDVRFVPIADIAALVKKGRSAAYSMIHRQWKERPTELRGRAFSRF